MISIIKNKLKLFFRDRASVFFSFLFPLVLIFLLGNFLEDVENAEDAIGDINVCWYISIDDKTLESALTDFVDTIGNDGLAQSTFTTEINTSLDQLNKKEISAVVSVTGNPAQFKIYAGNDDISNRTVKSIVTGFIENYNVVYSVMSVSPMLMMNASDTADGGVLDKDFGSSRTMIDYYAVSILVMTIFMVSIMLGTDCFVSEKENNTMRRLFLTPKKPFQIFIAGVIGQLPQSFLQTLVIMIVSVVVFGAHYAATFSQNLLLVACIFVITITANTIGVLIGICSKKNPMLIILPVMWIILFLSGSFAMDITIDGFTDYLPPYIVQNAIFELTTCGREMPLIKVTMVSAVLFVILVIAGGFIYQKKSTKNY